MSHTPKGDKDLIIVFHLSDTHVIQVSYVYIGIPL